MRRGERLVDFRRHPLDWSDFRLVFRQTADVLRRYEVIESADHTAIQSLARDGDRLQAVTTDYYTRTRRPDAAVAAADGPADARSGAGAWPCGRFSRGALTSG